MIVSTCAILVLALTDYKLISRPVNAQFYQTTANDVGRKLKRSAEAKGCQLPPPLKNGHYISSSRRCGKPKDALPACRMVPGTQVPTNWPIYYECDPGYILYITDAYAKETTGRGVSACADGEWSPTLPECVESHFKSKNLPQSLPSKEVCGKPSKHLRSKRKVQGTVSKRGAWPWMVVFGMRKDNPQISEIHWFCAGTLLTTRHILTPAHCVADYRKRNTFFARLDDINLDDSSDNGLEGAIEVEIHRNNIIPHPSFRKERVFSHNIAIVKLNSDLPITDFVRPVCLPTPDYSEKSFDDEIAYFTSWGQTDDALELSRKRRHEPVLHEIKATIVNHADCNHKYRSYESDEFIIVDWNLMCASVPVNKSSESDEGSPLMLKVKDQYYLIGVTATTFRYYDNQFPRLFTRVSVYLDWILANLK